VDIIVIEPLLKMSLNIFGGQSEGFMGDERDGQRGEAAPNNTIYIGNLNEKVPIDELKDTLFTIFEEYGEVIDVNHSSRRSSPNATYACADRPSSSSGISTPPWRPSDATTDENCTARRW
jgi:hypothetical protein